MSVRWYAENGWVCAEFNGCTCGGSGLDGGAQHQPGCGLEPLVQVGENAEFLVAEHNATLPAPHPHGGTETLRLERDNARDEAEHWHGELLHADATVLRMAAALGRVESLCEDAQDGGASAPFVMVTDLRAAIADPNLRALLAAARAPTAPHPQGGKEALDLGDAHARFHDQPGNMMPRNEDCPWEGCEFVTHARFVLALLPAPHPQGGTERSAAALRADEALNPFYTPTAPRLCGHCRGRRDGALCAICRQAIVAAVLPALLAPTPHPQGGTLRAQIEALCDADDPDYGHFRRSLRALLAAAPAPTEAGEGET